MKAYYAYKRVGAQRYREVYGLDFEDFEVGLVFNHRPGVTVSQQDNKEEALDTMNSAQLHYDRNYAGKTEWKRCLGVSTLTLQCVMGSSWKTFAKNDRILKFYSIDMTSPVFDGATLYAKSTILEAGEYPANPDLGVLKVETLGVDQAGQTVSKIVYDMLIYRKGNFPGDRKSGEILELVAEERFCSHRRIGAHEYMEQTGIYFEDLNPGEIYEHRPGKTVTIEENLRHCLRSLEWNPVYTDFNYIGKYFDGRHKLNEIYVMGLAATASTHTFGRVVANLSWNDVEFGAPAFAGDTLYCESEIAGKRESKSRPTQGILTAITRAFNQKGEKVFSYKRTFLLYKKGLGPYEAAGY